MLFQLPASRQFGSSPVVNTSAFIITHVAESCPISSHVAACHFTQAVSGRHTTTFVEREAVCVRRHGSDDRVVWYKSFTIICADFEAGFMFTPEELRKAKILPVLTNPNALDWHRLSPMCGLSRENGLQAVRPRCSMSCWKEVCG